ncbi:hypothetical protein [Nonomuraea sp. NPDC048916]|uniref:hypothetical protein n=1 Tax=Nonomuraea sp. NPDC048916 TaxID=3154232 RepID=UPI0033DF634A
MTDALIDLVPDVTRFSGQELLEAVRRAGITVDQMAESGAREMEAGQGRRYPFRPSRQGWEK